MNTTNERPTLAHLKALGGFYKNPDASGDVEWDMRDKLTDRGYIERANDGHDYKLTDKARAYITDYRNRVEQRDIENMTLEERWYMVSYLLDPTADKNTFLHIINTDRSTKLRELAFARLAGRTYWSSSVTLTPEEWTKLAHNTDKNIRIDAAKNAPIEAYRDERDGTVLKTVINACERNETVIPHDIVLGWYHAGNTESIKAMTADDIDMVLDDAEPDMLRELLGRVNLARQLTIQQAARIERLIEQQPDKYACIEWTFDYYAVNLSDDFLRIHAGETTIRYRLGDYRKAYREYVRLSHLFADPDGAFAQEQRALALTEE